MDRVRDWTCWGVGVVSEGGQLRSAFLLYEACDATQFHFPLRSGRVSDGKVGERRKEASLQNQHQVFSFATFPAVLHVFPVISPLCSCTRACARADQVGSEEQARWDLSRSFSSYTGRLASPRIDSISPLALHGRNPKIQ